MAEGAPSGEYVLVETRVAGFSGSPGQRTTGQAKVAEADAGCLPGGPEGNSRPGNRSGPATEPTRRGATGSPLPLGQPTHAWLRTKGRAPGGEQPPGAFLLAKLAGDEHPVSNSHRVLFARKARGGRAPVGEQPPGASLQATYDATARNDEAMPRRGTHARRTKLPLTRWFPATSRILDGAWPRRSARGASRRPASMPGASRVSRRSARRARPGPRRGRSAPGPACRDGGRSRSGR